MFDIKVIKAVEFGVITEDQLIKLIKQEIAQQHPDVEVTELEFTKRKSGVEVAISGRIKDEDSAEPVKKKEVQLELPLADDVPEEEEETTLSRDGVLTSEMSLIDEVLAEEEDEAPFDIEPEETPVTTGKSIAELFG